MIHVLLNAFSAKFTIIFAKSFLIRCHFIFASVQSLIVVIFKPREKTNAPLSSVEKAEHETGEGTFIGVVDFGPSHVLS
jgi:hypothetical protein